MPGMKILAMAIYAAARGYILKGCDSEELSGTIRKVRGAGNSESAG
jgi:hypothetical protein